MNPVDWCTGVDTISHTTIKQDHICEIALILWKLFSKLGKQFRLSSSFGIIYSFVWKTQNDQWTGIAVRFWLVIGSLFIFLCLCCLPVCLLVCLLFSQVHEQVRARLDSVREDLIREHLSPVSGYGKFCYCILHAAYYPCNHVTM